MDGCINCTARHAKYVGELEENTTALSTELEELKRIRNDTKRRVEIAEQQQHMKRLEQVQGWLLRVEGFEAQVEKLLADAQQQMSHKCVGGWCPGNFISSYGLGKNVAKKLQEVNVLKTKGTFEIVADKLPLASGSGDERPSEPTVGLESTFDEVCNYIWDEQVGVIGLYGMGGVGKTTLLTQINNKLCNTSEGFEVVIWVTVSKNPNLAKVQDAIGERIGFNGETWTRKSQEDKAIDIFRVLKRKKFILLLDDLWDRFDLKKMGVPIPDKRNKSKVVFTTRSKDVCGRMGVHRKIEVKCLTWEKAWDLFQQKVGEDTLKAHREIPELAKIVAKECSGLPLVLITIGRAMACKSTPQEWHHAIAVLKKSTAKFSGMDDEVFPLLKFSYDALPSDIVRSCFLYCSLFPEDFVINKQQLIEYWISEGYLDGNHNVNGAENQGHEIIGTLIHACLLEEHLDLSSRDLVWMHDVVRDMALWIGCECGRGKDKFQVHTREGLTKAPEVEKWKVVERMSLMLNDIEELKEAPLCPNLSTLLLGSNELTMISEDFFQSMPNLRVLDMSRNPNLDIIPMRILELVTLQYLNLSDTKIVELPIEFKNLVDLKVLVLNRTRALRIIPVEVLSSFKKLQVLHMYECGATDLFGVSEKSEFFEHNFLTCCPETLVAELECLKGLNYLTFTIKTASAFSPFINSPKLQSCSRVLLLCNFTSLKYLDMSFLESTIHLEALQVKDFVDLKHMTADWAGKGMENLGIIKQPYFHCLRVIWIKNCPILKELTWLIFAPSLEVIAIEACHGMEEVISGHQRGAGEGGCLNPLSNLTTLVLVDLPNLKCIYSDFLPFPCLKNVIVGTNCPKLKKLPFNFNSAKGGRQVKIRGYDEWWNALEWEDEATRIAFLPTFRALSQLTRIMPPHYKFHMSLKSDLADLFFTLR